MPRSYKQILMSQDEGVSGGSVVEGGTLVAVPFNAPNANNVQYITDLVASVSDSGGVEVLNGTKYLWGPIHLSSGGGLIFTHSFKTPLKSSAGTKLEAVIRNYDGDANGTMSISFSGYRT